MAVGVSIYAKQVTWNSNTWSNDSGGTIAVTYDHESRSEESRSGDDEYPTTVFSVDKNLRSTVRLQEVKQTAALGGKGDMVVTLSTKSGTATITMSDMVIESVGGNQQRGTTGDVELRFIHESDDGTTVPIT